MSTTTFRNMARATATRIDIESGKRLIPDTKKPGQFKVLLQKPNVVMSLFHFRDIGRMNKAVRSDAWALVRWASKHAPERALEINKAAVFLDRHDCSKLSAEHNRELSKEYHQHRKVMAAAERLCYGLTNTELDELDAAMDKEIV